MSGNISGSLNKNSEVKSDHANDSLSNLLEEFCASPVFLLYLTFSVYCGCLRALKSVLFDKK